MLSKKEEFLQRAQKVGVTNAARELDLSINTARFWAQKSGLHFPHSTVVNGAEHSTWKYSSGQHRDCEICRKLHAEHNREWNRRRRKQAQ